MKIVEHDKIDFIKWDEAILRSDMPLVFAQAFYLNATSPGWDAIVKDDYRSVMPVTAGRKFRINYISQPPFTPQLGAFGENDPKLPEEFLRILEEKYKYISLELNAANVFASADAKIKRTFTLNLEKEYVYNSNTKRNISKATKKGLLIEEVKGAKVNELTRKHLVPFLKKRLRISVKHVKVFNQLVSNANSAKHLRTFIVKNKEDKICAIAHFIFNKYHAVYLKGTNFDRNSGSMHFLMNHAIEYFKNNKVKMFDFGGGQNDSLANFYSGFGAGALYYKVVKINNLPKPLKWLKK
jgi:hypothetical protein